MQHIKRNGFIVLLVIAVLTLLATIALARTSITDTTSKMNEVYATSDSDSNCDVSNCLRNEAVSGDTLPDEVVSALQAALDDEYRAQATYQAVMDEFGMIRPFSNIIKAEQKHQDMLIELFTRYDIPVPTNPYDSVEIAPTLAGNCSIGVQAEIDNASLYRDDLLPAVSGYSDIETVFNKLLSDSQERHLPAFERCAP